jgi:hypothetical protein
MANIDAFQNSIRCNNQLNRRDDKEEIESKVSTVQTL